MPAPDPSSPTLAEILERLPRFRPAWRCQCWAQSTQSTTPAHRVSCELGANTLGSNTLASNTLPSSPQPSSFINPRR